MKKIAITILILSAILAVQSFRQAVVQSAWQEISLADFEKQTKKAEEKFSGKIPYQVKFSVTSYKSHVTLTAHDTKKGVLKRSGDSFLNSLLGITSIQNERYHFVVDSTDKTIMVKDPLNKKDYQFMTETYKQFKEHVTKIEYMNLGNGVGQYNVLYSEKVSLQKTELTIDATGLITKSVTYYRKAISENPADAQANRTAPRVELRFYDYKTTKATELEKEFSESNYFMETSNHFSGAGACKNYKVTDNRYKPR